MDFHRSLDAGFRPGGVLPDDFFLGSHLDDRRGIGGEQVIAVGEHGQVMGRSLDGDLPFHIAAQTHDEAGRFILLAGKPIREPIVQHGPFVMNTMDEIREAITDYQMGKFK